MAIIKDTDNQIVLLFPTWALVLGGFCFLFAAGFGTAFVVFGIAEQDIGASILFACVGFGFFLGGVYCCHTTEVTFDHALGNMIIREGLGFLSYRTRRISKKQVQRVGTTVSEEGPYVTTWAVSLQLAGRFWRMKITTVDESSADYLANRIRAFAGV